MEIKQLTLDLFTPPTFQEILDRQKEASLSVTVSKRLKKGWYVLVKPLSGRKNLVVPGYLEDAPEEIKHALIEWALLPRPRKKEKKIAVKKRKKALENSIRHYIQSCGVSTVLSRTIDPQKAISRTRGQRHDLREIFDSINASCFDGKIDSLIRWGKYGSTLSYQTTVQDKKGICYNLISIGGAYDHPAVPEFAIKAVIHHEMLHIAIPPYRKNGRRVIHGTEFKRAEREYEHYDHWRKWERNMIHKLSREMKRKKRDKRSSFFNF
ncbi:MAG: hypothetical protein GF401_20145 [Chitinivibrionales bacterium]|nr:hypothetical protein [Chitinivibrionales bacterium]